VTSSCNAPSSHSAFRCRSLASPVPPRWAAALGSVRCLALERAWWLSTGQPLLMPIDHTALMAPFAARHSRWCHRCGYCPLEENSCPGCLSPTRPKPPRLRRPRQPSELNTLPQGSAGALTGPLPACGRTAAATCSAPRRRRSNSRTLPAPPLSQRRPSGLREYAPRRSRRRTRTRARLSQGDRGWEKGHGSWPSLSTSSPASSHRRPMRDSRTTPSTATGAASTAGATAECTQWIATPESDEGA
jgi:hypothetical protein